ncbi:PREDICTED: uncharacterized protein LOC106819923, partial [Priapulus caudatus]|uniref:Uncharacterized protein LOC106819923 n=1 Tax=Priapulus caudatus TaxID=37621 RepID=A0ABM1F6A6_PRICU
MSSQLGVSQAGARRRILDGVGAVHKQEWEDGSLPSLREKHDITCPDAVSMMSNVDNHIQYIGSSVGYLHEQCKTHPVILQTGKENTNVVSLYDKTHSAMTGVRELHGRLNAFKQHLEN